MKTFTLQNVFFSEKLLETLYTPNMLANKYKIIIITNVD